MILKISDYDGYEPGLVFGQNIYGKERSGAGHKRSVKTRHTHNIPGTKLVRRFIKRARGENHSYRKTLMEMKQFVDVR